MVYRECIASRDRFGSAANYLTSYCLVFWSQMLLKAWRGGLACGWSPGSASCGGCDFSTSGDLQAFLSTLDLCKATFQWWKGGRLHWTKMWRKLKIWEQASLGTHFLNLLGGAPTLHYGLNHYPFYSSSHPCNSATTLPALDNELHPLHGASFEAGFSCGHLC